jgi:hypothetical protein
VVTTEEGRRETLKADRIVTALPMMPDAGLLERFVGSAGEIHALGDAREPVYIVDAVADGARVARLI